MILKNYKKDKFHFLMIFFVLGDSDIFKMINTYLTNFLIHIFIIFFSLINIISNILYNKMMFLEKH
jgi:hypothetical protein